MLGSQAWQLCQEISLQWFSLVRRGLLDFRSAPSPPPPLSSPPRPPTPHLNHDHPTQCSLLDLNHDHPRPVFPAGPQPRPSTPSVPCRTSTTTIHAQCSLPTSTINHDLPRPVFPAGPRPRPSAPSFPRRTSTTTIRAQCSLPDLNHDHPCRTSTTTFHAQCSLPDLNRDHPRPVFLAGPQPRPSAPNVPCRTSTTTRNHNHKHTTTNKQPQTHLRSCKTKASAPFLDNCASKQSNELAQPLAAACQICFMSCSAHT